MALSTRRATLGCQRYWSSAGIGLTIQPDAALADHDVGVALGDVDDAGLQAASSGRPRPPVSSHRSFRRRANTVVKLDGMCCATITGPGKVRGNGGQNFLQRPRPAGGDADDHGTEPSSAASPATQMDRSVPERRSPARVFGRATVAAVPTDVSQPRTARRGDLGENLPRPVRRSARWCHRACG